MFRARKLRTSTPGAAMLIGGPQLENPARLSCRSVAATSRWLDAQRTFEDFADRNIAEWI